MRLAIITHANHLYYLERWYAYGPYVREINIWIQHAESVIVTAPVRDDKPGSIELAYEHDSLKCYKIPAVSLTSIGNIILAIWFAPLICIKIWKAMSRADHIHLRCPGNIGLLGCLIQIFFPKKKKTAKYAGNWDPMAKQPLSYRFQKWLLSNSFLTRNMQVLVYGEWTGQSKNIKPFFTATYPDWKTEIKNITVFSEPFKFVFAGSLVPGKRPIYAIMLIDGLRQAGFDCRLDIYGEGIEQELMLEYIVDKQLSDIVKLHGNHPSEILENAYQNAHFLVLPSKSEGWPKVVAEAMFWGAIPVVTSISCVPWMLDFGKRGLLISAELQADINRLCNLLSEPKILEEMSKSASNWSREYTLDRFEKEIQKLV